MKQETFTDIEYSYRKKKTKREEFLEIMEEIIPWDEWVGVIEPYYPKESAVVRPWGSKRCCGCTCFKSGSICLTQRPKMPSTTAMPCENSQALTL